MQPRSPSNDTGDKGERTWDGGYTVNLGKQDRKENEEN